MRTFSACSSRSDALPCFIERGNSSDLLPSNIILTDGRGALLASQLRDPRRLLPVLLRSGNADGRACLEGLQREGTVSVNKPFITHDLLMGIKELLIKRAEV